MCDCLWSSRYCAIQVFEFFPPCTYYYDLVLLLRLGPVSTRYLSYVISDKSIKFNTSADKYFVDLTQAFDRMRLHDRKSTEHSKTCVFGNIWRMVWLISMKHVVICSCITGYIGITYILKGGNCQSGNIAI